MVWTSEKYKTDIKQYKDTGIKSDEMKTPEEKHWDTVRKEINQVESPKLKLLVELRGNLNVPTYEECLDFERMDEIVTELINLEK